jgi:hypothetical protein
MAKFITDQVLPKKCPVIVQRSLGTIGPQKREYYEQTWLRKWWQYEKRVGKASSKVNKITYYLTTKAFYERHLRIQKCTTTRIHHMLQPIDIAMRLRRLTNGFINIIMNTDDVQTLIMFEGK